MKKEPLPRGAWWKIARFWIGFAGLMFLVIIVLGIFLGPLGCSIKRAQQQAAVQTARLIVVELQRYAADHGGHYPEGGTSTEVFQHLMDDGYINDPAIFFETYMDLPGKTKTLGRHLEAQNVGWDLTAGVRATTPGDVPVVFVTGYRMSYLPAGAAIRLQPPSKRTWSQWWNGDVVWEPFFPVATKDGAMKRLLANADGAVTNVVPADIDNGGEGYRQLKP